jgi:hypothetical protein
MYVCISLAISFDHPVNSHARLLITCNLTIHGVTYSEEHENKTDSQHSKQLEKGLDDIESIVRSDVKLQMQLFVTTIQIHPERFSDFGEIPNFEFFFSKTHLVADET